MRILLIGGTGLISTGIVKALRGRGISEITMFNRGKRENTLPDSIKQISGDRNEFPAFEKTFAKDKFDVVIDMIAFNPAQAESDVRAFAGRCTQLIFCSTVCTYGVQIPPGVVVDESFPQEPISEYGRNKVACEKVFLDAHAAGAFAATIIRPSHTYGPGNPMIDQLEFNPVSWDRIAKGFPVLIADGGMGLWNSTHRDDVGKLFAHAALNKLTYGRSYNATTQRIFTWRDYYREAGAALGTTAKIISMPADWIVAHDPKRFGLLGEISRFHGPYSSAAAMRDVPEFKCEIDFVDGARLTFEDVKRRNAWKTGDDELYARMIRDAQRAGINAVDA